MKQGERYRWEPGLRMDPDTGKLVELLCPITTKGIPHSETPLWRARVLPTGREISVYRDELRELEEV